MHGAELDAYLRFGAPVHMGKGTRFRFTEKHMLLKAVDSMPGMGDYPFPWQLLKNMEVKNETDDGHSACLCDGAWADDGDEYDGVCG